MTTHNLIKWAMDYRALIEKSSGIDLKPHEVSLLNGQVEYFVTMLTLSSDDPTQLPQPGTPLTSEVIADDKRTFCA